MPLFPRGLVLSAALIFALAACGSDDSNGQAQTIESESTTTTIDPFAVPSTIDAAYAEKVLVELYSVRDEITRSVATSGEVTPSDKARLGSLFFEPALNQQIQVSEGTAARPNRNSLTDVTIAISNVTVLTSSTGCIWGTFETSGPTGTGKAGYALKQAQRDAENETGWRLSQAVLAEDLEIGASC